VTSPRFDFGDTTTDEAKFVATAFVLENTGVKAYAGQATNIKQVPVAKAAVSILMVEARHAAAILGRISGKDGITPTRRRVRRRARQESDPEGRRRDRLRRRLNVSRREAAPRGRPRPRRRLEAPSAGA
jgi:hypothetical protein